MLKMMVKGLETGGCPECHFEGQGLFGLLEVVREGGRERGGRGGGEFLWRAKSDEREGEGKVDCLLSSSRTGTYTRNRTLGEIYH